MKKAVRAKVYGKVQGVWFRKFTRDKALELGIKGIVRNEPDGSVYVEAEGEPDALEAFVQWLHRGSPLSRVDRVVTEEIPPRHYQNFEIEYT
ncbi:MAG: acylphosphatase [Chlorobi bacterium]|nr:acylphosphatase [Chlorobiota bacterium]